MTDERTMEIFRLQAEICKTLADPNRLMILHELKKGEMSVGQLIAKLMLPQSNVSRHLAILRERDVVSTRREATTKYYSLSDPKIAEAMRLLERMVMLKIMDNLWIEHLTAMEQMRLEASWQTLRQTRAVDAYKAQGFQQFNALLEQIQHDVVRAIFHAEIKRKEDTQTQLVSPMAKAVGSRPLAGATRAATTGKKVGRNEPCPCGSGKKYKHCCGS
ncbi:metalloregulator ArsR/SmtB family transcription factor [Chloroflexota bacterium]